jgi:hypothetical protein
MSDQPERRLAEALRARANGAGHRPPVAPHRPAAGVSARVALLIALLAAVLLGVVLALLSLLVPGLLPVLG